jgi:hypothetical protein
MTRKKESEEAYYRQVLSNVRFYTGPDFEISKEQVEFLRGIDIQTIVQNSDRNFFLDCFRKLDYITLCVEQNNELNLTTNACIRGAAGKKIEKLVNSLLTYRSRGEVISLLVELRYWKSLVKCLTKQSFLRSRHFPNIHQH